MTLSRIFKTIFLVEFIKGLLMAIKEMFKKSKTVNLEGDIYIGESKVEVENIIPRLNAITEQNTEARIYVRGDRVVAYGRIMEIMAIINSAGYVKVALITQQ